MATESFVSVLKHSCHIFLYACILVYLQYTAKLTRSNSQGTAPDPVIAYGLPITIALYSLRMIAFLALPQVVFNCFGLFFMPAFSDHVVQKYSTMTAPRMRIRAVTRGTFPELVFRIVERNLALVEQMGVTNYLYEVVTDNPVSLPAHDQLKQIVVPPEYRSRTGALFKSRALQYCLEPGVYDCDEQTWIVHLDEETLLTENSVKGIINFICDGRHHFGQGLVTYANDVVVNWITTTADSFRVADDMGKLRTQLKIFHRPLFSWKGSYVVTNAAAEQRVSYDNGPDGSIAEDCYFAMKAFEQGYTFNWIEGEMWEKSPFTLGDLLKQRKRWIQGIFLVVHNREIKFRYKVFLAMSLYAWLSLPLSCITVLMNFVYPAEFPPWLEITTTWIMSVNVYMFIFGALKSFPLRRMGLLKSILCLIGAVCCIPMNIVIENIAVIWAVVSEKHQFYIVDKDYLGKTLPQSGITIIV
ncbi:beta-1,4-mannosyltransferase egh-like [Paramacrobiotus metropolitanus]|uniref:beta-1,4-mannosyltransferase egh-like n=1 Tax=Paramacrobiotus metropolitanus TaxID=2943436 RepID=UPI0024457B55|nr:beta-1,4-mannosyltransferase egh-like [Paramacrobiotus metropolitanus]